MDLFPVTDLKQWAYCPRIVFYHRFMPSVGKPTFKMREAVAAQDMIEKLELRRSLAKYGFEHANRRFGLWLNHPEVGLSGKLDLLLDDGSSAALVDYKLTAGDPGDNHRFQFAGYALLVEAVLALPVRIAFLYRIPDDRVFPIEIDPQLRQDVCSALADMRELRDNEVFPPPTPVRGRCVECEYANHCADVW